VVAPSKGFEHGEVGGAGFVEASEQAIDSADTALGRDDRVGPALAGMGDAGGIGDGFEGAHDGRADRDDALAGDVTDAAHRAELARAAHELGGREGRLYSRNGYRLSGFDMRWPISR